VTLDRAWAKVPPLMRKLALLMLLAACKTGAPVETPKKPQCQATLSDAPQGCSLRAELSESSVLVKFLKCGQAYDACEQHFVCACSAK
jgi:hypothetical protein